MKNIFENLFVIFFNSNSYVTCSIIADESVSYSFNEMSDSELFSSYIDGEIPIDRVASLSPIVTGGRTSPPKPWPETFGTNPIDRKMQSVIVASRTFKFLSLGTADIKISSI